MWPKHEKRSWTTRDNARMSAIPQLIWDSVDVSGRFAGHFPIFQVSQMCFNVYLPTRSINMIRDGVYSGGLSWCFQIMTSGWFCSRCMGWPLILILSNGTLFPMLADFVSEMVAKWFNWEVSFPCLRKVSFQTRALELKESFSPT